jgi:arylsulfatase A-like enzyme
MKLRIATGICVVLGLLAGTARAADEPAKPGAGPGAARRPNVLLIFADDLGWRDTGFTGSDFYETPNLDKLARDGMAFTNAYAGAGNCAPSRACLLSGQYGPRHGVYAVGDTDRGPKPLMRMVPIPNAKGLAPTQVTVAEALKAAGYATGIFGKWHLGGKDGAPPAEQGFDAVFDPGTGGRPQVGPDPKGVFSITAKAGEFMAANKDRPFFCYVAHHGIHSPLEARPESLAKFKAKPAGKQHSDPLYAACTYDFDDAVGQLLKKLADLGLEKDTLVVFTSDNGGVPRSSQEPLRGNKGAYYDGGIREPMAVRWPGVVAPGSKCDTPVINLDFYPTFLEAAGAKVPDGKVLDGASLVPALKGRAGPQRAGIFWHFPGYLNQPVNRGRDPVFRTRPVTAMRSGNWKLMLYHEEWQLDGGRAKVATNNAVELYDLSVDPGERNNLALSDPKKRDEMLDVLLDWMKKTDAKMPTQANAAYDPKAKVDPDAGKLRKGKKEEDD